MEEYRADKNWAHWQNKGTQTIEVINSEFLFFNNYKCFLKAKTTFILYNQLVYERNPYFGLGWYRNRYRNYILKEIFSYGWLEVFFSIIKWALKPNFLPNIRYFWIIFKIWVYFQTIKTCIPPRSGKRMKKNWKKTLSVLEKENSAQKLIPKLDLGFSCRYRNQIFSHCTQRW